MLSHFGSLIPRQRLTESLGQSAHGLDDGCADGFGAMTGEWWAVLDALTTLIPLLAGQV